MEAAKADGKTDGKAGQQTEKKKAVRKSSGSNLLKASRVLEGALKSLSSYPDLLEKTKSLRKEILTKFVEAEEKSYPV